MPRRHQETWLLQPWHWLCKLKKSLFSLEMISITNAISWWGNYRKCKYTYCEVNQVQQGLATYHEKIVYMGDPQCIEPWIVTSSPESQTKWDWELVQNARARWVKIVFWSPFMSSLCRVRNENVCGVVTNCLCVTYYFGVYLLRCSEIRNINTKYDTRERIGMSNCINFDVWQNVWFLNENVQLFEIEVDAISFCITKHAQLTNIIKSYLHRYGFVSSVSSYFLIITPSIFASSLQAVAWIGNQSAVTQETWAGCSIDNIPNSKVLGANMGPIWGWQDPGGPHVGPMKFAISQTRVFNWFWHCPFKTLVTLDIWYCCWNQHLFENHTSMNECQRKLVF